MILSFLGRFLIGFFQGGHLALWRVYIGETSEKAIKMLPEEMRAKSMIKYTNFFMAFTVGTTSVALGPGMCLC